MNTNKKFIVVLLLFSVLPNLIAFFPTFFESKIKGFYASDYNSIVLFLIFISISGPLYILYKNNKSQNPSKIWNVIGTILALVILIYWYVGYSLSNFGF